MSSTAICFPKEGSPFVVEGMRAHASSDGFRLFETPRGRTTADCTVFWGGTPGEPEHCLRVLVQR